MMQLDGLLDPRIQLAQGDPRANWPAVLPVEEASIERAVDRRRREFRAGRSVARQAMLALGSRPEAIAMRADRSPAWPEGLVGSISHCEDLCVAVVARSDQGWLAVGVDVETRAALPMELLEVVCGAEEREWLAGLPMADRGDFARLIFSAKECVYKCQHSLSGRLFDFDALTIRVDRSSGEFTARFNLTATPFLAGDELNGRYLMDDSHIVTAVALRRDWMTADGRQEALRDHG